VTSVGELSRISSVTQQRPVLGLRSTCSAMSCIVHQRVLKCMHEDVCNDTVHASGPALHARHDGLYQGPVIPQKLLLLDRQPLRDEILADLDLADLPIPAD
jgi:hypothetical protein